MSTQKLLIQQIRQGEADAWKEVINLYEGRLLAFCRSRVNSLSIAEDLVQDTFMGFLVGLPNFNDETPLETFLFSIAGYKIIDHLRKHGRRQTHLVSDLGDSLANFQKFSAKERMASSLLRSREKKSDEVKMIIEVLESLIEKWHQTENYERLKCIELLFVCGLSNKEVANLLEITEQQVANHKQFVLQKLKDSAKNAGITPEIY